MESGSNLEPLAASEGDALSTGRPTLVHAILFFHAFIMSIWIGDAYKSCFCSISGQLLGRGGQKRGKTAQQPYWLEPDLQPPVVVEVVGGNAFWQVNGNSSDENTLEFAPSAAADTIIVLCHTAL